MAIHRTPHLSPLGNSACSNVHRLLGVHRAHRVLGIFCSREEA